MLRVLIHILNYRESSFYTMVHVRVFDGTALALPRCRALLKLNPQLILITKDMIEGKLMDRTVCTSSMCHQAHQFQNNSRCRITITQRNRSRNSLILNLKY